MIDHGPVIVPRGELLETVRQSWDLEFRIFASGTLQDPILGLYYPAWRFVFEALGVKRGRSMREELEEFGKSAWKIPCLRYEVPGDFDARCLVVRDCDHLMLAGKSCSSLGAFKGDLDV